MDQPLEEGACGEHHRAGPQIRAGGCHHAHGAAVLDDEVFDGLRDDIEAGLRLDGGAHGGAIELAVGLRARPLHGRPLGAVQHPELNAGLVGHAPHQPVQRIDLAHQMPLAEPTDRRIARHLADGVDLVRDERRASPHARSRGGRLAPRVAAADNDDVIGMGWHWVDWLCAR